MVRPKGSTMHLPMFGTAGLMAGGERVPLRVKSLAILYYLALEGPTPRATLAELLWEHASARQNLRVELHELRQALRRLGVVAFERREDPLSLPPHIVLDTSHRPGEMLEGLEGASASFREWLLSLRGRALQADERPVPELHSQAVELARRLAPPYLLIVRGSPLAGFKSFALRLAGEMNLPFIEGVGGTATAVRFLPLPQTEEQIRHVLKDRRSVWVLPTAPFGEDHSTLLELRAHWPPDRASFVKLKPISWPDAAAGPLHELTFERAAQVYLCSGGDSVHLEHLVERARTWPGEGELPLPQQVRAAYQRESRFLSYPARLALERLSVHPGTLDEGLLDALEAHAHMDELERRGWLVYEDEWFFASEPARRVLYQALQPGRRSEYHRNAARYFAKKGAEIARLFHEGRAHHETIALPGAPPDLPPWAQAVWGRSCEPGVGPRPHGEEVPHADELWYEPPEVVGEGWGLHERGYYFVRNGPPYRSNALVFPGHDEAVTVRVRGRGYVDNVLGVGMTGSSVPLVLEAGSEPLALFAQVPRPLEIGGPAHLMPLSRFDVWLEVPAQTPLRFSSHGERVVVEFEVQVFKALPPLRNGPRVAHARA